MEKEWLVILNPVSGGGRGKKDQSALRKVLDEFKFPYILTETSGPGEATTITRAGIQSGHRRIMGLGGDGTMNEILNGFMTTPGVKSTDLTFGFIPVGTGNDWIRTMGIPRDYEGAAKALKTGNFFFQDVGKLTYTGNNGTETRYFGNMAGFGYDAFVTKRINAKKRGKRKYLFQLLSSLLKYKHTKVTILVDGKEVVNGPVFSVCAGIGRFNGNGMMQVPAAMPDDSLLDLTVIHNISKWGVIRNTSNLYAGTHIEKDFCSTFRGKSIEIHSEPGILAEVDGEICGMSPFSVSLLPRAFKVIAPLKNTSDFFER